jgi:hypothetical protein
MGLGDEIRKGVKDVTDAVDQGAHQGAAEAEHARRDAAGDTMTAGEKLGSMADEAKHRAAAGVDQAKRTIRDNT